MKRILLLSISFLLAVGTAWAQRTVSGRVSSDSDGSGIPGVNVILKGTTTGTTSDLDGNYRLSVPEEGGTLVFSFIGLSSQEVEIGARSVVDVAMSEDVETLSEVVVTALGISKEKASLGYGVSSVSSDDLEARPEADVGRVLRGKVPGVDITQTSGIAGTGTNIIIRGYSSITGSNQPLFVVDGVPFNTDSNNDRGFATGGATASSRFLDLDPNNIADISILKGLSATVLYGEAGRNGVVLVTTKSGRGGASAQKGLEITFNQSYFVNEIAGLPEDQDEYGNGWQNFASAAFSNWGAPMSSKWGGANYANQNGLVDGTIAHPYDRGALADALPQYAGARYDYKAYDNLQDFFVTGAQVNTSIGIQSRINENSSVSVNYGYLSDDGFIEFNNYTKHNFSLGGTTKLQNGLRINSSFNFITSDAVKPPAAISFGSNPAGGGTSLFSNVLYTPRSVSLFDLEYANPVDGSSIYYRGGNDIQHPLWTLNNVSDEETVNRFTGNINLFYEITDWLSVSYRIGVDTYSQFQEYKVDKGGRNLPNGLFVTSQRNNFISDQVFNFNVDYDITSDLNISGVIGANLRRETRNFVSATGNDMFVRGLFNHGNFQTQNTGSFFREENTPAIYTQMTLGYKNFAYLNFQGRNDWTSTLEEANRSIFYPSVSASFLPMEALNVSSDIVNMLKLRVGYGSSAGYPSPYRTRNVLGSDANAFVTPGGSTVQLLSVANRFGNLNLEPEVLTELEGGVEARLLDSRIGIDLSLYNKASNDLIIDLQLDPSTGYGLSTVNASSLSNKGVELGLNAVPVRSGDFEWNTTLNFTRNVSNVESVADGIDEVVISGYSDLGNFAIPGEWYGMIKGYAIQRDDNNEPILSATGAYQQAAEIKVLGNPNPNFNLSFINSFSYKFVSFRFQFDYVDGGVVYGTTASTLMSRGIAGETDIDRFIPVVARGVDADGNPNGVQITSNRHHWEHMGIFYDEQRIFDGTTVRLREISLTLTAPKSLLSSTPFGRASVTFAGQNLWYNAPGFPPSLNFDPEVQSLGVGNGRGFDYMTGPTAKKYGATLSLTF